MLKKKKTDDCKLFEDYPTLNRNASQVNRNDNPQISTAKSSQNNTSDASVSNAKLISESLVDDEINFAPSASQDIDSTRISTTNTHKTNLSSYNPFHFCFGLL